MNSEAGARFGELACLRTNRIPLATLHFVAAEVVVGETFEP
jgi:hypothetical protein